MHSVWWSSEWFFSRPTDFVVGWPAEDVFKRLETCLGRASTVLHMVDHCVIDEEFDADEAADYMPQFLYTWSDGSQIQDSIPKVYPWGSMVNSGGVSSLTVESIVRILASSCPVISGPLQHCAKSRELSSGCYFVTSGFLSPFFWYLVVVTGHFFAGSE